MKTKNLSSSAVSITGTVAGGMASRVIAENLPVKYGKLKHGILFAVAVAGASMLDRKDKTQAFTQDIAIGMGAVQLGSLVKEFFGSKAKDGAFKTALGNPTMNQRFLAAPNSYDFIPVNDFTYEESPVTQEINFR